MNISGGSGDDSSRAERTARNNVSWEKQSLPFRKIFGHHPRQRNNWHRTESQDFGHLDRMLC